MSEPTSDWGRGSWMQTFTGRQFFPLDPHVDDIDPIDIAHALSLICRYGGHTRRFYSVAEHCVLMSRMVPPEDALWALLHDATEAYVGDMVRPLKQHMPEYRALEDALMNVIAHRFDLPSSVMPTTGSCSTSARRCYLWRRLTGRSKVCSRWVSGSRRGRRRWRSSRTPTASRSCSQPVHRSTRPGAGGPVADSGTPSTSEFDHIATMLSRHRTGVSIMGGWVRRNGKNSDLRYGWWCSCGVRSPEAFKVDLTEIDADKGRFAHVAEVICSPASTSEEGSHV